MLVPALQTRRQMAVAGLLVGIVASLLVGVVAFEEPVREALPRALGSGLGLAIGFYVLGPTSIDSETTE